MPSYVVTGATRGIGLEFIRQLSASPEIIVFALIRSKKTGKWLEELAVGRKNVHILEADISDVAALKLAAQIVSKFTGGTLDILINNAALLSLDRSQYALSNYPEDEYDKLEDDLVANFKVNVVGVIHTINAFLPLLQAGNTKKVITISSGAGDMDLNLAMEHYSMAPYSISKAALNLAVVKYAANPQYKKDGFVFLSLSPGVVDTSSTGLSAPTPAELEDIKSFMAKAARIKPSFAPISPETSVKKMLGIVDKVKPEESGAFISQNGNKDWF